MFFISLSRPYRRSIYYHTCSLAGKRDNSFFSDRFYRFFSYFSVIRYYSPWMRDNLINLPAISLRGQFRYLFYFRFFSKTFLLFLAVVEHAAPYHSHSEAPELLRIPNRIFEKNVKLFLDISIDTWIKCLCISLKNGS